MQSVQDPVALTLLQMKEVLSYVEMRIWSTNAVIAQEHKLDVRVLIQTLAVYLFLCYQHVYHVEVEVGEALTAFETNTSPDILLNLIIAYFLFRALFIIGN